jgi:hypothetical protein
MTRLKAAFAVFCFPLLAVYVKIALTMSVYHQAGMIFVYATAGSIYAMNSWFAYTFIGSEIGKIWSDKDGSRYVKFFGVVLGGLVWWLWLSIFWLPRVALIAAGWPAPHHEEATAS